MRILRRGFIGKWLKLTFLALHVAVICGDLNVAKYSFYTQ